MQTGTSRASCCFFARTEMASLCALRLRLSSRLQLQPGPRSQVFLAPAPHHRRTAAPRPPVGCSSSASQQVSGGSPQPPERQQQQTAAGSSSARVATGSGLVELRFVSSSPATAESEASSGQPQTGGKALFADRALLWHASPSFARCIDEAMRNDSGGASKQIVIPMPASEEASVWEPVLRLLRQEDLLPVNWVSLVALGQKRGLLVAMARAQGGAPTWRASLFIRRLRARAASPAPLMGVGAPLPSLHACLGGGRSGDDA